MWRIIFFGVSFGVCLIGQKEMVQKLFGNLKENLVVSSVNSIIITALSANILAVFGKYSIRNISLVLLALGLIFCAFLKDFTCKVHFTRGTKLELIFIFCLICFFLIYGIFTITPFGIGRDPSVYFYEGIHISQSGSIYFPGDSFIAHNYAELQDIVEISGAGMYSAYEYGISDIPGDIVIQFLHMFPCMLAIGYDLGGVLGLQLVNSVLAVFCAAMVFIYMREIISDKKTVWIAFLLCALNPAQIYSARITQSELLCQLIYMLSIYYFSLAWKRKELWIFALSGMLAGLMTFNRIDMYILGIGIYILALYHIWIKPENMKEILFYSLSYTIVGILALFYGYNFSYPYYKEHWDMGVLFAILMCNGILFGMMCFSVIIRKRIVGKKTIFDPILFFAENRNAMFSLLFLLMGMALFVYFLRPIIAGSDGKIAEELRFRANALVEFCFYTSPIAIIFAVYGIYKLVWNVSAERIYSYLPWAFMGMSNFFVYIYNPSIASDHIWASRRWVTICIPFVLMLTAVGISSLYIKRITSLVQIFLSAGILIFFMFQGRGFLFKDIGGQIWKEYEQYAQILDEDEKYFADNKMLVTLLQKIWGKSNVYRVNEEFQNSIESYLENRDEAIYYIGNIPSGIKNNKNLMVRKVADYTLHSNELERAYGRMPDYIRAVMIPADIYRVEFARDNKVGDSVYMLDKSIPERLDMEQFGGENRNEKKKGIVSNGNAGYVLYGPYDELENGTYEVSMDFTVVKEGNVEQNAIGFFEVVGREQKIINRKPIYNINDGQVSIAFSVNNRMDSIEYRFYTYDDVIVEVDKVELLQLSDLFMPGLDEWKSISNIVNRLSMDEQDLAQVAYFYGTSSDGILLGGLTERIANEVSFTNFCSLSEINQYDILVARLEDMEWFSLLKRYNLMFREGDYLVFAKNNAIKLEEEYTILSKDGYVNMEALVSQLNGRYFVGDYKPLPSGGYEFRIELPEKLSAEMANVFIYQNNEILAQSELLKGEDVTIVSVEVDNNLTNLSVEVVDSYNRAIENTSLWVKQNNTANELFYKRYLQPIIDKIEATVGDKKFVLCDSNRNRIAVIEEYIDKFHVQATIMDELIFVGSESVRDDFIISEKRCHNEILLLKAGYTVVYDTHLYALFVSEKVKHYFDEKCFLSDGEYLMTKYYQNITNRRKEGLALRKGSYEFDIRITMPIGYNASVLEGGKIWFENNGEVIGEPVLINHLIEDKDQREFDVYVPLYFENNVNNLKVHMELDSVVGITCEIGRIKYKSLGRWIDLKQFEYSSGSLEENGIYSSSNNGNTIYGPYYELEAGKYVVQLIYETDDISDIIFDVAANGGETLISIPAEMSEGSNGEYSMELPFEVKDSDKLLEFRTHIPAEREFLLKEAYIFTE